MAPSPVLGRISHRFPFQNRTDSLAVGRTLIVHPHLPVLTRGADVRMPHKPLLDVERSLGPRNRVSYLWRRCAIRCCPSRPPRRPRGARLVHPDAQPLTVAHRKPRTAGPGGRCAFRTRDQAPSRPPDPVLLEGRSVVALASDIAWKH